MTDDKHKELIKTIFGTDGSDRVRRWQGRGSYKYSHYAILDRINPDTDSVLDIGCGSNMFYGKVKNLVAIDPVPCFDPAIAPFEVTTLEDFTTTEKFDVILCLGSIQFGSLETITAQLEKINALAKPSAKVFWRFQLPRSNVGQPELYYNWTLEKLQEFADLYGFTQQEEHVDVRSDPNGQHPRQYVEWVR